MNEFEAVKQYAYPDESQSLRIKEMTEIAASASFANPIRTANNAEVLLNAEKDIPSESLGLEPVRNNEGLRHALWTLNTYCLRLRPDGLLQPESKRGDWEVSAADRKLARVVLNEWRPQKPGPMQYRENDVIGQYLAAIKGVELLTAEEEVALAKDIEAGLYAVQRLEGGKAYIGEDLSVPERKQYAEMALLGKDAFDRMYEANLRLVVNLARKYTRSSVPYEDLIQEGNLGLKHAIEKFDYRMGYKFSVYATRWIEQALQSVRATQSSHPIVITKHELQNLKKILKVMEENEKVNFNDLSIEEISTRTKIRADLVYDLLNNHNRSVLSLDKPITRGSSSMGAESSLTLTDVLMDQDEILVDDEIVEHDLQRRINEALSNALAKLEANPRRREKIPSIVILKELYGIGYNTSSNSAQVDVAKRLGLGRSAVAEAEKFALDLLNKDEELRVAILAKFPHAELIDTPKVEDERVLTALS